MGRGGTDGRVDQGPDADPEWVAGVRHGLAEWYEGGHRALPWRADRDAYRILVSETMLVQTTVAAVVPYFERFLSRFPTAEALAEADETDVLKAWEGLGYYRRARQLHAAAKAIVAEHGGHVPDDPDALLALPGVGRYIAGAVLSFAFDRPAPIVEANTQRVLARLIAWRDELGKSATQARLWTAAERLVPDEQPGRFNQAIMELGATVCTPGRPSCLLCPIASHCRARAEGIQDTIPAKLRRPETLDVEESCVVVRNPTGEVLIVRRAPGRLWEGFWEFPTLHISGADPAARSFDDDTIDLAEGIRRLTAIRPEIGPVLTTLRFGVTRHRVVMTVYEAQARSTKPKPGPGMDQAAWERPEGLSAYTFGSAQRKIIARLTGESGSIEKPNPKR